MNPGGAQLAANDRSIDSTGRRDRDGGPILRTKSGRNSDTVTRENV